MTFVLNLIASSSAEIEWSLPLMSAWLVIALTLSIIEMFRLTSGFSSQTVCPAKTRGNT